MLKKSTSRFEGQELSGSQQIYDLLDGAMGAVVGGFEFAGGAMGGVGAMMETAVGQGTAQAFVKENEEQGNLDAFDGQAVGIA